MRSDVNCCTGSVTKLCSCLGATNGTRQLKATVKKMIGIEISTSGSDLGNDDTLDHIAGLNGRCANHHQTPAEEVSPTA